VEQIRMKLYYTACGGEQILAHGFQDEDYAWEPPRPGQLEGADGEWWGVALSEQPQSWGLYEERFLYLEMPEDVAVCYRRAWEDGAQDFLVPASICNQYEVLLLLS
jgi:hypothetical protein